MKAVILMNMGGATSKDELKMFLTNMFNDANILTVKSNFLRSMIAKFIVTSRLNSAWSHYEEIGGKSPINDITLMLTKKLQYVLGENFYVDWVMRYTHPMAMQVIQNLQAKNIKEVILIPLYPQYSTTTTKSSIEDFLAFAKESFDITIIEPFYERPNYNKIILAKIKDRLDQANAQDFHLIFSAHGLPQKVIDKGDPYQKQVEHHVQILSALLASNDLHFASIHLAYQSKVGPMKWIDPPLEETLEQLAGKNVIIFPIAFTIDNSETVFELEIEYKEIADKFNIHDYRVCKCPNDSNLFVDFLKELAYE